MSDEPPQKRVFGSISYDDDQTKLIAEGVPKKLSCLLLQFELSRAVCFFQLRSFRSFCSSQPAIGRSGEG